MRPQTRPLAERVRRAASAEEQLTALEHQYAGETAYIFSCGPSVSDVWCDRLADFLRDKLVITVKRTFTLLPAATDFHIYNRCRHQDYSYPEPPPIRIAIELEAFRHDGDIRLPFWYHQQQKWLHSVLFSRALDRWDLSRSAARGWGP